MEQRAPTFCIGPVPVYGDAALAPMAGFSDVPFRVICRELGASMSYTACILDDAVVQRPLSEAHAMADFRESERPMAVQLLAKDEERLLRACDRLMTLSPDIFDLNLGCPARRVTSHGRGSALLKDPPLIGRLVSAMVRHLPVPVTAKIRLGWDEGSRNHLEVAHILEDSGVAMIAVHGRTKEQGYSGRADWAAIAEVKAAASVPVLGNGDIREVADIARVKHETGVDGVLIGRGAVGNPWIFAGRDADDITREERLAMVRRHLDAMLAYYADDPHLGLILFRKHIVKYVRNAPGSASVRPKLVAAETREEVETVLDEWATGRPPVG